MSDPTPEERMHELAIRLTAQAKPWSSFHPYQIKLDRAQEATRGFLVTFKAVDGDASVTVRASLEDGAVSVRGSPGDHSTGGKLDLAEGFSYDGHVFEDADDLAGKLGGEVAGEFAWIESGAE